MAKVLLGANIVGISGKLGGHVFQGIGQGRTIIRSKVSPIRHAKKWYPNAFIPTLNNMELTKQKMSFYAQSWRTLTFTERKTWLMAKEGTLTGMQLFINNNSAVLSFAITHRTYPGPVSPLPVFEYIVQVQPVNPTVSYTFNYKLSETPASNNVYLYVSSPTSAGRLGAVNGYRLLGPVFIGVKEGGFNANVDDIGLPGNYFYNFAYRFATNNANLYPQRPIPISKVD